MTLDPDAARVLAAGAIEAAALPRAVTPPEFLLSLLAWFAAIAGAFIGEDHESLG